MYGNIDSIAESAFPYIFKYTYLSPILRHLAPGLRKSFPRSTAGMMIARMTIRIPTACRPTKLMPKIRQERMTEAAGSLAAVMSACCGDRYMRPALYIRGRP